MMFVAGIRPFYPSVIAPIYTSRVSARIGMSSSRIFQNIPCLRNSSNEFHSTSFRGIEQKEKSPFIVKVDESVTPSISNKENKGASLSNPLLGVMTTTAFSTSLFGVTLGLGGDLTKLLWGAGSALFGTLSLAPLTIRASKVMNSAQKIDYLKALSEWRESLNDSKLPPGPNYLKLCQVAQIEPDKLVLGYLKVVELAISRAGLYGAQPALIQVLQTHGFDVVTASLIASFGMAIFEGLVLVRADAKMGLATLGHKAVVQRFNAYFNNGDKELNLVSDLVKQKYSEFYILAKLSKSPSDVRSIEEILTSDELLADLDLSDEQKLIFKETILNMPEEKKNLTNIFSNSTKEEREIYRGIIYAFLRDISAQLLNAYMIQDDSTSMGMKCAVYTASMTSTNVLNNAMIGCRIKGDSFNIGQHMFRLFSWTDKAPVRLVLTIFPVLFINVIRSYGPNISFAELIPMITKSLQLCFPEESDPLTLAAYAEFLENSNL